MHISPPKPTLTAGIPGNTRPGLDVPLSEKFDTPGLQANVSEPVANETFPLNNRTTTERKDAKSKPVQLHSSSLTSSDVRESFPGILGPSQDGKPVVRISSGPLPTATPSKETSSNHQFVRIPQTSVQKEGLSYNSKEPSEPRLATEHNINFCRGIRLCIACLPKGSYKVMLISDNVLNCLPKP